MLFPEFRKKTRKSNISTPIQRSIGGPCQCNKKKKKKTTHTQKSRRGSIKIGREEITLSIFADNTIVWIETPKKAIANLLEFIREFSKTVG